MLVSEAARSRDDVEHADAKGLLLRTGHNQVAARSQHHVDRTTKRTRHSDVTVFERGNRSRTTLRRDQRHVAEIHAQVLEHLEQLEMRHVADRRVDVLTRQRRRSIVLRHVVIRMRNTVVGIGIRHRNTHDHMISTAGHIVRERRQTLRIRNVDIARLHRQRHVVTRRERQPVHRQPQNRVIGLLNLRNLVGRRPLQEIRHVELIKTTRVNRYSRGRRRSRGRRSRRFRRRVPPTATGGGHEAERHQEGHDPSPVLHVLLLWFPL